MKALSRSVLLLLMFIMANPVITLAHEADSTINKSSDQFKPKETLIHTIPLKWEESAVLTIKNQQDDILCQETVSHKEAYTKKYDLKGFPNGEYTLELSTSNGVSTAFYTLAEGQIKPLYFKPAVRIESELIKMILVNQAADPVSLKIYNTLGEVLYEEEIPAWETFAKGLNISQLKVGQYSLTVLADHYVYSKNIQVK